LKTKGAPIKKRDAKNSRLRQAAGTTHSRAVLRHRDGVSGGEWGHFPHFLAIDLRDLTKNVLDPMVGHKPYYGNRHGKLRGPIGR
jgi:hypothetical protein